LPPTCKKRRFPQLIYYLCRAILSHFIGQDLMAVDFADREKAALPSKKPYLY